MPAIQATIWPQSEKDEYEQAVVVAQLSERKIFLKGKVTGEWNMPMHDWTRVKSFVYHHFHGYWLNAICSHLNRGHALPAGYYALAEQVTRTMGPDVLKLQAPDSSLGLKWTPTIGQKKAIP